MQKASLPNLKWPLDARPQITNAGHFPLSNRDFVIQYKGLTHALHLHEYDGTIDMADRRLPLTPGTVTLSPAKGITMYDLPRPGRHWCIHFQMANHSKQYVAIPLHLEPNAIPVDLAGRMAHITSLYAAPKNDKISHTAASFALQELLLLLACKEPQAYNKSPQTQAQLAVDQILQLIHSKLDQSLKVATMADQVQLSQNYLARHFRQRMGMTIPNYILEVRIKRAQLLLKTTNMPVKQIASQVGLPDAQHFNKQFRRLIGHSPTESRKS